jgi:hypothetical protein
VSKKIFFFHNPKAGGTSIRHAIEEHYPDLNRAPLIENDIGDHARLAGQYAEFAGSEYYAGHYGRDVFDAVNDGHICITNFRHPVVRLLSLYNYFRYSVKLGADQLAEDRFYAVALARAVHFSDFLADNDPRVTVYTCNQHFRQLTNSPWSLSKNHDLHSAIKFIDQMRWYYVCEHPELSMLWFQLAIGIPAISRRNVTGVAATSDMLDGATVRLLIRRNALDMQLYEYAVNRLLKRIDLQ